MLEQAEIKTPEYVSLKYTMAGLGSRAPAFIIDQCVIGLLYLIIFLGLFFSFESSLFNLVLDQAFLWLIAGVILLVFAIEWSYFILCEFFWKGKTIGKRILGIRVIQDNGHRITLLSSMIRNLLRIIDELPVSYLLGIILILVHSKHKRLGDLVAGTIVVHDQGLGRKKNKKDPIEKVIRRNNWTEDTIQFDSFLLDQVKERDFELVKTYCQRYLTLANYEKDKLTRQVGDILLPKLAIDPQDRQAREIEQILFVLYLKLRDQWDY
ncbi:RDD family protein [Amphibacillus sp. Q70]|uniref:RDD family protein n=1 Tax=Amphibacillus sp. Q70 TaxID=3453416 RepID=UPI003F8397FD